MKNLVSGLFLSLLLSGSFGAESPICQGAFKTKSGVETRFEFHLKQRLIELKVHCDEPEIKSLRANSKVHDVDVWKDDLVEIFINPARKGQNYAQFAVAPTGVSYDAALINNSREPQWNPAGIEIIPQRDEKSWSFTMRIPAAVLLSLLPDLRKTGPDQWSFNLVRTRKCGAKQEVATLSPCSHWLDTEKYTKLNGVSLDYAAMKWTVDSLKISNVEPAGKGYQAEMEGVVDNQSDKMRFVRIAAYLRPFRGEKSTKLFEIPIALDKKQMFRLKQKIKIPALGKYQIWLTVSDKNGPLKYAETVVQADFTPMQLAIVSGAYRGKDIFSRMNTKTIVFQLINGMEYPVKQNTVCKLTIADKSGKIVAQKSFPADKVFKRDLQFPLPSLAPGKYICRAAFSDPTIPSAVTELNIHPAMPCEIWVDNNGSLMKNGNVFFPIGSFGSWEKFVSKKDMRLVDFELAFGPVGKSIARLKKNTLSMVCYPEPADLWSHHAAKGGEKRALRPIPPENAKKIAAGLQPFSGNDKVFGWYLCDEPSESRNLPLYMEQLAEICHKTDPYHPTLITFNNAAAATVYGSACDVAIIDYFPGFHEKGKEKTLDTFAALLNDAAKRLKGKPLIAAPPLYAYADSGQYPPRYPEYKEMRCMTFSALTCDAVRGICWNDGARIGYAPGLYFGVPAITREVRALERFWLSHDSVKIRVKGKDAKKLQWIARKVNGHLYVLTVNPTDHPLQVSLELPANTAPLKELAADKTVILGKTLHCAPLQVRIFTSDPAAPVLEPVESVQRKIDALRNNADGNLCHASTGSQVIYSATYNRGHRRFSVAANRAWINDHLYSFTYRFSAVKKDPTPWIGIEFKKEQNVAAFEIAWNLFGQKMKDNEIRFALDIAGKDNVWKEIPYTRENTQRSGNVVKLRFTIPQTAMKKFRIRFLNKKPALISPCEIKAFAK